MMTVRFASGFSVQYNRANYLSTTHHGAGGGFHDLYTREGGDWIARVPITAVVESERPCRTYDARIANDDLASAFLEGIRDMDKSLLARVKKELGNFNARRWRWRP